MPAKPSISAEAKAMFAASALDKARPMLVAIGGKREWNDTKDHWRNKLARKVGINARRIRAILSNEPIKLSADEYLSIEARFRALDERLEEDLRALSGVSPAGEVRAGRAPHSGASGDRAGVAETRLRTDRR